MLRWLPWIGALPCWLLLSAPVQADLHEGLVGYWSFDGNLAERVQDRHAIHRGVTRGTFTQGQLGQALAFDGQQYVEIAEPDFRAYDSIYTSVSFWIKIHKGGVILDKGSCSWTIFYNSERDRLEYGARRFSEKNSVITSSDNLGLHDGQWHHVVCVPNPARFYIDGEGIRGRNTSLSLGVQGQRFPLAFGGHPNRMPEHEGFQGELDEVAIWNRPLDPEEAFELWKDGKGLPLESIQTDTDADGIPDVWERRHRLNPLLDDTSGDFDIDGLTNMEEFLLGTHPNNRDTDHDGLNDAIETETWLWRGPSNTGTSPLLPDSDGDGLNDALEDNSGIYVDQTAPGTSPLNADSDSDGFSDGSEWRRLSDPTESTLRPRLSKDLLLYHSFDDEAANESLDWQGTPAFEPGITGRALFLDGQGIVRIPAIESLEDAPFSISTWYKIERHVNIFSQRRLIATEAWNLTYQESNGGHPLGRGITFRPATSTHSSIQRAFTTDDSLNWYHLVVAYDPVADEPIIYINGHRQPTGSESATTLILTPGNNLLLGGVRLAGIVLDPLHGRMDELAIWNRLIDPGEVAIIHAAGRLQIPLGQYLQQQRLLEAPDRDGDGLTDRWETAVGLNPLWSQDADEDLDDDGLTNHEERSLGTHPGVPDTDQDGLEDHDEILTNTDPTHSDTDLDGLTDGTELSSETATDPLAIDTDGDGLDDGTERTHGTDPTDPLSRAQSSSRPRRLPSHEWKRF